MQRDGLAARVRELESAAAALQARAERAVELERLLNEAAAGREAAEAARARLLHTRDELATNLLVGAVNLPERSQLESFWDEDSVEELCGTAYQPGCRRPADNRPAGGLWPLAVKDVASWVASAVDFVHVSSQLVQHDQLCASACAW